MTTLTKKELIKRVEYLEWERVGYKETIRNREAMIDNAAAEYKKREGELLESWTIDSKQAIAYIHELQDDVAEWTDKADKEYRKYRDEVNFGQRNQFKAHEEIEALEQELAAK